MKLVHANLFRLFFFTIVGLLVEVVERAYISEYRERCTYSEMSILIVAHGIFYLLAYTILFEVDHERLLTAFQRMGLHPYTYD